MSAFGCSVKFTAQPGQRDASLTIEGAKAAISHVHLQPVKIDTLVLRVALIPTDVPTSQYSHSNLVNHVLCSLKR
jgi:hypothetical protein